MLPAQIMEQIEKTGTISTWILEIDKLMEKELTGKFKVEYIHILGLIVKS